MLMFTTIRLREFNVSVTAWDQVIEAPAETCSTPDWSQLRIFHDWRKSGRSRQRQTKKVLIKKYKICYEPSSISRRSCSYFDFFVLYTVRQTQSVQLQDVCCWSYFSLIIHLGLWLWFMEKYISIFITKLPEEFANLSRGLCVLLAAVCSDILFIYRREMSFCVYFYSWNRIYHFRAFTKVLMVNFRDSPG